MSASIPIVKMSGAGNDFVVIGEQEGARLGTSVQAWARRVCRRGLSVGADGVLVVTAGSGNRARVRFLNPDGSETFCGNGSRCAARFAVLRGLARSPLVLETAAGDVPATVRSDSVTIVVSRPQDRGDVRLETNGTAIVGRHVLAGVPHFVLFVDDLAQAPLSSLGPFVRWHPRFAPGGVNVNVVCALEGGAIGIRTWERGVEGETLSCGSGALAAALVASQRLGAPRVRVRPASGIELTVEIPTPDDPARASLTGDARVVFEGVVPPEGVGGF